MNAEKDICDPCDIDRDKRVYLGGLAYYMCEGEGG